MLVFYLEQGQDFVGIKVQPAVQGAAQTLDPEAGLSAPGRSTDLFSWIDGG